MFLHLDFSQLHALFPSVELLLHFLYCSQKIVVRVVIRKLSEGGYQYQSTLSTSEERFTSKAKEKGPNVYAESLHMWQTLNEKQVMIYVVVSCTISYCFLSVLMQLTTSPV